MKSIAILFPLLVASCGRYADFSLPAPVGEKPDVRPRWEVRPNPVLGRGAAGEWDAVDVLNPAVARFGGAYVNLYSGYDGRTWHTGLATSADGIAWRKQGKILSPQADWEGRYIAANGAALADGGTISYWYQAGDPPRIGLARSSDGRTWSRQAEPVLGTGPRGSWDERGVADPYVIRAGGALYLFYLGQDRARRQRLGIARSPDGIQWTKLRSNPILDSGGANAFDENGLGEPAVWMSRGRYWMLYTGRDRRENRRLGLADSSDGARWNKFTEAAVLSGEQAWNSRVVCDPAVEVTGDAVRVWFGGGDVAHPAENIHGQIGYATLHLEAK